MSDFKSKMPDLKELGSMASKLFKGIKSSVEEIIKDYKEKRAIPESETKHNATEETKSPKSKQTAEAKKEEAKAKDPEKKA